MIIALSEEAGLVSTSFENEVYVFKIDEIHIGLEKTIIKSTDDDVTSITFIKSDEYEDDMHCYLVFASKNQLIIYSLSDEQSLYTMTLYNDIQITQITIHPSNPYRLFLSAGKKLIMFDISENMMN